MAFKPKAALLAIAAAALTLIPAHAQTSKGTLVGVARDQTGAVIPHAQVSIHNQSTGLARTAQTAGDGTFRFDALDPGPYTIDVSSTGFAAYEVKDVAVQPSITTSYDVTVTVGQAKDVVTVEADQATINTENGQLAGVVTSQEIDKLPIFTLNPVELALTVPGVQPVTQGAYENGVNIQVNGARPRSNNFLMDGQEINDVGITGQAFQPQIPDIFESVTVLTNAASAEFGRGGGGIVNMVTKQGTNTYHGTLFERYAGSGLNSIPGTLRGSGQPNPRQNTHSFGFTAGGRIIRDKLFAFGAAEWQRTYGREQAGLNLLPDANGVAVLKSITDKTAATQVALLSQYLSNYSYLQNNIQFTSGNGPVVSKTVGNFAGCGPSGAVGPCTVTFNAFERQPQILHQPDTQWMYRVDYHPWTQDSLSFRYLHDRSSLTPDFFNNPSQLAGLDTQQGGPSELAEGMWTHVFGPNLLNEFRVAEARLSFLFDYTPETVANPLNNLPTITLGADVAGTSTAGYATFATLGHVQNDPQGRREDLYQFQDTVSWTKGRHTLRMGADIGRIIEIDIIPQNTTGALAFASGGSTGGSFGNFLLNQLGTSGQATITSGPLRADSHGYRNAVFAQDDIKFSPDFTLNLGIRYDYLTNPENSLPYPAVDPSNPFTPINTVLKVKEDYNNVAPRVGFAYSPHGVLGFLGDGKTSIRGGFGVFYDSTFSNILTNTAETAPNTVSGLLTSTASGGLTNATGLIPTIPLTLSPRNTVESEATNTVNPVTYQYNLGIERELPGQVVLGVRYVGTRGSKLFANQQYNYFLGTTGQRVNPARGTIILRGNYAASDYNGLEISGRHNFRHGFSINTNYVFSKDLDNGSDIFSDVGSPTSYSANLAPGGRSAEWAPSAFDHRHFFSIAYVWQPAGFHASNAAFNAALGAVTRHWTFSGVTQLQSGQYTTINTNGIDTNRDGSVSNDRPVVGNPALPITSVGIDGTYIGGTPGVYYDMAAANNNTLSGAGSMSSYHFVVPYMPANQYLAQEIGRDSFPNPGSTIHNMALEKGFGLSYLHFERGTFIFRAEAQNVFNHNDRAVGDTDVLDAGYGYLDAARTNSQRVVILWGKLQF